VGRLVSPIKETTVINAKTTALCLAIILWAVFAANFWRFSPPDPDCVEAVSIYAELIKKTEIIGLDYSALTTTLGSHSAKKSSENPITAALMVRLLKDAGVSPNSVVAVNASGSFPGFVLSSLSACTAIGIKTFVIASIGASSYGANIPGNTIADMLLEDGVKKLDYVLLVVTPGGSSDRGTELDAEELERIADMLEKRGIPFIRPVNLADAIALRESLFTDSGCTLLINIGGTHASSGADTDFALMSGILKPNKKKTYEDAGLIQYFLKTGKPVIQILNVKKLYAAYGLEFDEEGELLTGSEKVYRWKRLPAIITLLPVLVFLLAIFRYSRYNQRL
jgi:poly-gamma-glutamate system protein